MAFWSARGGDFGGGLGVHGRGHALPKGVQQVEDGTLLHGRFRDRLTLKASFEQGFELLGSVIPVV